MDLGADVCLDPPLPFHDVPMSIRLPAERPENMKEPGPEPTWRTMKYLCLVYLEEEKLRAVADGECQACGDAFRASGVLVAAEALQPVGTASTVRVRNGKASITDGPFAETKEQLAGFYLLEARDLNDAIQMASRIPPAREGSIEVRPVRQLEP
jgi:hypothetical protein